MQTVLIISCCQLRSNNVSFSFDTSCRKTQLEKERNDLIIKWANIKKSVAMERSRLLSQKKWLEIAAQKVTAKTTALISENCNEVRIYRWMKFCRVDECSLAQMTSPSCAEREGFPPLGFAVRSLAMAGQDAPNASLFTESEASWSISHSLRCPCFFHSKELCYEYSRSELELLETRHRVSTVLS